MKTGLNTDDCVGIQHDGKYCDKRRRKKQYYKRDSKFWQIVFECIHLSVNLTLFAFSLGNTHFKTTLSENPISN
jgi:hypothetical protein